jgi:hypothetical protein
MIITYTSSLIGTVMSIHDVPSGYKFRPLNKYDMVRDWYIRNGDHLIRPDKSINTNWFQRNISNIPIEIIE